LFVLKTALKVSSALSPRLTDEITLGLFQKPRRSASLPMPEIAGIPARSFHVQTTVGRLAAWSWGTGPTVLLVHGWEGHAAQLVPFAGPLLDEGFRVVVFDMPAHGRSEGRLANVVKMAQAVREVAAEIASLAGEPLHAVIAHSLGGAASVLAMKQGVSAEHVVLLAPVAEPRPFVRQTAKMLELSEERIEGLMEGFRRIVGGDFGLVDVRFVARQMDVPALIFHDPADREVPFEHGESIAYEWRHSRFVRLEGLGHRRLLKDPKVIEQTIRFVRTPSTELTLQQGA
jgi:pimeloyl-ACP methyl ester carboxylesterase